MLYPIKYPSIPSSLHKENVVYYKNYAFDKRCFRSPLNGAIDVREDTNDAVYHHL